VQQPQNIFKTYLKPSMSY